MNLSSRSRRCGVPLAFTWNHAGQLYRVTPWPEVRFERSYDGEWVALTPTAEVLAAGAAGSGAAWRAYLEFLPTDVRELLGRFRANRLLALNVAARCPDLVGSLGETPALTAFLGSHAVLRGLGFRWHEVNAVFERGGVYGLLEWLGLPARRETLAILANLVTPDVGSGLLEPLRRVLWAPAGVFALAQLPVITPEDLIQRSHALAA